MSGSPPRFDRSSGAGRAPDRRRDGGRTCGAIHITLKSLQNVQIGDRAGEAGALGPQQTAQQDGDGLDRRQQSLEVPPPAAPHPARLGHAPGAHLAVHLPHTRQSDDVTADR